MLSYSRKNAKIPPDSTLFNKIQSPPTPNNPEYKYFRKTSFFQNPDITNKKAIVIISSPIEKFRDTKTKNYRERTSKLSALGNPYSSSLNDVYETKFFFTQFISGM